jgi:hypothetical protein
VRDAQALDVWEGERHMDGVGEWEALGLREKLPEEEAEREAMELEADADPVWQPEDEGLCDALRDRVGLGEREGDAEKEGEPDAELEAERDWVTLAEREGVDVPLREAFVTEGLPELLMEGEDVPEPVGESANRIDGERDCEGEAVREGVTVPQCELLVECEALALPLCECVGEWVALRHSEGEALGEVESVKEPEPLREGEDVEEGDHAPLAEAFALALLDADRTELVGEGEGDAERDAKERVKELVGELVEDTDTEREVHAVALVERDMEAQPLTVGEAEVVPEMDSEGVALLVVLTVEERHRLGEGERLSDGVPERHCVTVLESDPVGEAEKEGELDAHRVPVGEPE